MQITRFGQRYIPQSLGAFQPLKKNMALGSLLKPIFSNEPFKVHCKQQRTFSAKVHQNDQEKGESHSFGRKAYFVLGAIAGSGILLLKKKYKESQTTLGLIDKNHFPPFQSYYEDKKTFANILVNTIETLKKTNNEVVSQKVLDNLFSDESLLKHFIQRAYHSGDVKFVTGVFDELYTYFPEKKKEIHAEIDKFLLQVFRDTQDYKTHAFPFMIKLLSEGSLVYKHPLNPLLKFILGDAEYRLNRLKNLGEKAHDRLVHIYINNQMKNSTEEGLYLRCGLSQENQVEAIKALARKGNAKALNTYGDMIWYNQLNNAPLHWSDEQRLKAFQELQTLEKKETIQIFNSIYETGKLGLKGPTVPLTIEERMKLLERNAEKGDENAKFCLAYLIGSQNPSKKISDIKDSIEKKYPKIKEKKGPNYEEDLKMSTLTSDAFVSVYTYEKNTRKAINFLRLVGYWLYWSEDKKVK